MTTLFENQDTGIEAQRTLERGDWSGSPPIDFLQAERRIHANLRKLAERDGADLTALASSANEAIGVHAQRATDEEIIQIAEEESRELRRW
ncbi:hypothetical protein [Crateriforma conspicua]|uniref:Uncharacterized protein n=1 Tax=Crateriforma conspicua TaxID=2527996 RepID=A0A5C5XSL5_9PLAN|nr:hypothetical protein [Crateriforma conspicua]TWT65658.1 hypothetical protein Pan14r_52060 [Crateriforma conspicua]